MKVRKMERYAVVLTFVVLIFCSTARANPRNLDRDLRIVGGAIARVHQFPHAVALVLHLTHQRSSFCGGSIIHPSYVLTVSVNFFNVNKNSIDEFRLIAKLNEENENQKLSHRHW